MEEEKYMRRCIQLAQNGLCNAAPNPMVGAVIVCDGKIIGEGYHVRCGEAHAEVNAIRSVKDPSLLKRSTIYVSLEPCAHYGKTPPCTQIIIEKGIEKEKTITARKLKSLNISVDTIMQVTGLSAEEIEKL